MNQIRSTFIAGWASLVYAAGLISRRTYTSLIEKP